MSDTLTAGFGNPVLDAQRCFRAVLDAMARPGTAHRIGGVTPPAPMDVATAATMLTLADNETPVWLAADFDRCRAWLAFHCGSAFVTPARAMFVVTRALPDLATLQTGSHEAPETAATVILQVASIGRGVAYRLHGPGLREPAILAVDGLPRDFPAIWQRNRAVFPHGIDMVLCAGDALAALPRSVTVQEN